MLYHRFNVNLQESVMRKLQVAVAAVFVLFSGSFAFGDSNEPLNNNNNVAMDILDKQITIH